MLRSRKFKFYHQLESVDCGPACLAMICSYHNLDCNLRDIKSICSVTRMGISVQDIVNGGNKIGFETIAAKISLDQIEEIPLPAILYWKQEHFVVLYDLKKNKNNRKYYIADPGYGTISLEEDVLVKEWMGNNDKGIVILFQPEEDKKLSVEQFRPNHISKEKSENIAFLLAFLKKNKYKYTGAGILLLVGLFTNWAMPVLFQRILDNGIMNKSLDIVWWLLGAQLVLFISNFISEFLSEWTLTKLNFNLSIALKEQFLHKLMKLPVSYFDTRLNTDTLERLSDQEKIKDFITWKGLSLILDSCNIIVFSVMLFFINTYVFVIFLILSILSILWLGFFFKLRAIVEYSLFLRQSENNNALYEFVMNMPEIKTNNAQSKIINGIVKIQKKLNDLELKSVLLNMYQLIGVEFLSKLKEISIIALCAYLIIHDNMSIGGLLGITYILGQLNSPIRNLISFVKDAQSAAISQKRLQDVYLEKDEISNELTPLSSFIGDFSISNISFKYPGSFNRFVLSDVTFDLPINKITAIVGHSGSGKTTLLKLLLRHHSVNNGGIFINDINIDNINPDKWRDQCGVVSQEGYIFSGTISENVSFSDPDPNFEKIKNAAKIACIDSFIDELPMGYNTKVGNIGIPLSGGQQQRILIARAVYRNPKFIFFDEATSSLDANNEKMIMNNLNSFFEGKTVFIIAHRLSTVKQADQILVLDKGQIVEVGNHNALVDKRGKYFELVKNQLELGN